MLMRLLNREMVLAVLLLATLLLAGTAGAASTIVQDVHLRADLSVDGPEITLGDLFENAGPAGAVTLAMAPDPGDRIALDAGQVAAIAREHGLSWTNARGLRRLLVARASQVVPASQIKGAVAEALSAEMDGRSVEIRVNGRLDALHAALDVIPSIGVEILEIEARTGRFRARIRVPEEADPATGTVIAGQALALTPVPVLVRTMSVGSIIGAADWEWQDMREDRLPRTIVLDPARLTGLALRRTMRVGSVLKDTDVMVPSLVERGDLVTLSVRRPGMELTATARSLQDGALDEVIRVRNTHSMRIIEARITGPGRADAITAALRTAAR